MGGWYYIYFVKCSFNTIKGSAVNNDGANKVGYTAPSQQGQTEVIEMALEDAGLSAEEISYIEGHGTGTVLGDPIELAALDQVYKNKSKICGLGSVKTNIGHLDTASGIAGLFKVIKSMQQEMIPATLY